MPETLSQESSDPKTPKPKRRWLQFNLRTLLVLTLVVGCGLGVMNERRKNARLQADIDALERFGCHVGIDPDKTFRPTSFDWLLGRKNTGRVTWVHFGSNPIKDAGLVNLKRLNPNSLGLTGPAITDEGLAHLKGLTKLHYLRLRASAITDAGLAHLKGLTRLVELDLRGTKVTKVGVAELQKALPNCRIVHDWEN